MWKLSIEDDQGNKTVVHLVRDEYTVGRAEGSTIRLTERNISRSHLRLVRGAEGWSVDDQQSYNGVFITGKRVVGHRLLSHGDILQLGDYRLQVSDEAQEGDAAKAAEPEQSSQIDQDRLVAVAGVPMGTEFALTGERLLVGRGDECDIVLNHASVSRVHAEISALGDGRYEILDRESANGVRINGVELKQSLLDARDAIEFGDVVLKFIPAGEDYRPSLDRSLAYLFQPVGATNEAAAAPPKKPLSLGARLGLLGAGLALIAVVAAGVMGNGGQRGTAAGMGTTQEGPARVLAEAQQLLASGDIEGAHQKITTEIPEDSNARQSAEFRRIEAGWADALLQHARAEADPTVKRALLDQVAVSPTVDSVRRKAALAEIAKLSDDALDISELPKAAPAGVAPKPAKPKPPGAPPGTKPASGAIIRDTPF